jgi:hypothetical protein
VKLRYYQRRQTIAYLKTLALNNANNHGEKKRKGLPEMGWELGTASLLGWGSEMAFLSMQYLNGTGMKREMQIFEEQYFQQREQKKL